jgi:hypothetical protein
VKSPHPKKEVILNEFNQHSTIELDVETYVKAVQQGDIKDLVLTFMLKQGLTPLQVLPNYLKDDKSLNYAVLVEWKNDKR